MEMKDYKYQLICLKHHLSEALLEKKYSIERVKDIRKQMKEVKELLSLQSFAQTK